MFEGIFSAQYMSSRMPTRHLTSPRHDVPRRVIYIHWPIRRSIGGDSNLQILVECGHCGAYLGVMVALVRPVLARVAR